MTEQIGWGLNDHDFLQQMVPRLERLPRPFARVADHAVAASSVRDVSRRAQGAEARRARRHVVRQLPAHDALLRSGARGLQDRAGARRPARRQRASSCSAITTPASRATPSLRAHDRHRRRRRGVDAERSRAAVHPGRRARRPACAGRTDGGTAMPAGQTDLRADAARAARRSMPAPLPYVGRNLLGAGATAGAAPVRRLARRASSVSRAGADAGVLRTRPRVSPAPAADCAARGRAARRARDLSRLVVSTICRSAARRASRRGAMT